MVILKYTKQLFCVGRHMKNTKVDYDRFFDNSSSRESLMQFIEKEISGKELLNNIWSEDCRIETKKLLSQGVKKARSNAAKALGRRGYSKPYFM